MRIRDADTPRIILTRLSLIRRNSRVVSQPRVAANGTLRVKYVRVRGYVDNAPLVILANDLQLTLPRLTRGVNEEAWTTTSPFPPGIRISSLGHPRTRLIPRIREYTKRVHERASKQAGCGKHRVLLISIDYGRWTV